MTGKEYVEMMENDYGVDKALLNHFFGDNPFFCPNCNELLKEDESHGYYSWTDSTINPRTEPPKGLPVLYNCGVRQSLL